jgi:hypothetical protein
METASITQLPEILAPEEKALIQPIVDAYRPLLEAYAELKKAMEAKFPNDAAKMPDFVSQVAKGLPKDIAVTEIKKTDDDNAEGTISGKLPTGEEKSGQIKFKRIDEKWRIAGSELSPALSPEEIEKIATGIAKMAEILKTMAQKINDGEFADANAAAQDLLKVVGEMAAGAPDAGSGDKPADAKEAKPADSAKEEKPAEPKKNKKDEPDPLEGTMPGPGVLRRG